MQTLRLLVSTVGLSLCASLYAHGQAIAPDTAFLAMARAQAERHYAAAVQDQSKLYNGSEYFNYTRYFQEVKGNQFFVSNQETPGSIRYDGQLYTDVPLLYDIRLDQVVIKQPTSSFYLQLTGERVSQFSLHGHTFVRIDRDSAGSQNIRPGFYDVLLNENIRVLARRSKRMQDQPSQNVTRAEFFPYTYYFIERNHGYYPVKSKGSVISLFPDQRKELQRFARANRLAFTKETREADIVRLASHYARLSAAGASGPVAP